ncbi:tetraacyldisaccharide 4'-kinase [Pontibacter vulgaris]|uniref:tetraacyldisaccharide 4'-kinase n=1 Tax=Pontibacter vulgaris TaxID=2905679 RepID=UPI001FA796C3|nr:tetraacyldisaccharide 4'-kinase [Pontibacter vulgaris]
MVYYLKLLLWPFAFLYGRIMAVRNLLYDAGLLPSRRFGLPVIAVGNLTVGGTGKTPHVEYLLRLLQSYSIATLSRGYKRTTKGFILADNSSTAAILGDEPFQYHQDFPEVAVAVCEDRVKGVELLLKAKPNVEVVVLDDAMQHRPIRPSFNILITDFFRPFYKDLVMPAGLLREPKAGAKRADVIIVSKCPANLPAAQRESITASIKKYSKAPVFFSGYTYGAPVGIGSESSINNDVILLTGIANAMPLKQQLQQQGYTILEHINYPDHHLYTSQDLLKLKEQIHKYKSQNISIITTRKDAVKLESGELSEMTRLLPIFYIPIEVELLEKQEEFDSMIGQHVLQQFKNVIRS